MFKTIIKTLKIQHNNVLRGCFDVFICVFFIVGGGPFFIYLFCDLLLIILLIIYNFFRVEGVFVIPAFCDHQIEKVITMFKCNFNQLALRQPTMQVNYDLIKSATVALLV